MNEFNTLDDFNVENKTILLRVEFNMPLDKDTLEILDTTRINLVIPTIRELIEKNVRLIILAHQGRKGSWDFISLEKHANALEKLLRKKVKFVNDIFGEKAKNEIKNLNFGEILVKLRTSYSKVSAFALSERLHGCPGAPFISRVFFQSYF